jgi:signal transduction histidine kinase/ligand-binding sensor domain-containing protein
LLFLSLPPVQLREIDSFFSSVNMPVQSYAVGAIIFCRVACQCSFLYFRAKLSMNLPMKIFILTLCSVFCITRGFSQSSAPQPASSNNFVVQQWNVEDGLPQSSIRCITQTHDGYLWLGTWNGLARFDGVRMTVFNEANTPNFHSSISSLHEDRSHRLWIGTDGGGLYQYRGDSLVRFDSSSGIVATIISAMDEDSSGRMWFGTDNGIFVYAGNRFLRLVDVKGFPKKPVTEVLPAHDGSVYLQFVGVVFHVRLSNDSLSILDSPFHTGGYRIAMDSAGVLWYGVKGEGLVRRRGSTKRLDRRFANVHPKEVFIPQNQEKWVLTPHGTYVLTEKGVQHFQLIDGIDLSNINGVFEDREGIIWITAEGSGLLRLLPKQVETFTTRNGLETNEIMCGMQDREGAVWIGTWLGGLARQMPSSTGSFISVPPFTNGMTIMAVCQSHDGTIWVGTWGQGVFTIHSGQVKRVLGNGLEKSTTIRAIANDTDGGVWIAGVYGALWHVKSDDVKIWNSKNGLTERMINSLLVMRDGDVWIGTDGGGVVRLSKGYISILKTGNGLLDNFCHVCIEDNEGAVWLESKKGLQRWKNGVLSSVTAKQGFDDDAAQFVQDDEGNYWIGGTHGIHRIRRQDLNAAADGTLQTLSSLSIGKADGMPIQECAGGSNELVWKTRDGALWFSTTHGAVRLDPSKIVSNPIPPGVIIEEVQVEHHPVTLVGKIVLHPQETKIEFHYTGINFAAPDQIQFAYRLEGFDGDWRNAGKERFAQYTNLEPGTYIFRVKAVNNAGIWNEVGDSVAVLVLPPFYATWWFRIFFVLFFLAVGPSIYFIRVQQLTREKEKQVEFSRQLIESQESERKRIATELHDGLGQNLLIIKNKLLVALQSLNKHSPETDQVTEASNIVSSTIEEVRSISHNLRPHQLDQLGITKTLRSIVRQANEPTSIEFSADIQDIDGVLSSEQEIGLFRIVQESFNNIIKHSGATKVDMDVVRSRDSIAVTIADNGKGISATAGFGISGMQERAKMFGWNLQISSELNKGTALYVEIPV